MLIVHDSPSLSSPLSSPPRVYLLPAPPSYPMLPAPKIAGLLSDGLPVILMNSPRIPRTHAELETLLRDMGVRSREDIEADFAEHVAGARDRIFRLINDLQDKLDRQNGQPRCR